MRRCESGKVNRWRCQGVVGGKVALPRYEGGKVGKPECAKVQTFAQLLLTMLTTQISATKAS